MAELNVGECLIYGSSGVYKVSDIVKLNLGQGKKKYYYLTPCDGKGDTNVYLPIDFDSDKVNIRKLLSKQEILDLIDSAPQIEEKDWIENPADRKSFADSIISGGNRKDIISLIKTLHFKELQRKEAGKKLYLSDERIMNCAEKVLYDEFAFVLGIMREDVITFITDRIEGKN